MTADAPAGSAPRSRALQRFVGLFMLVLVLLWLGGESTTLALRYERAAVLAGEYWRLITAHLVHGTSWHLMLNLVGLGLICALFPRDYTLRQWLVIGGASAVTIDLGFVLYEPQLHWYVGLSGVLHGALAAGALAWWRTESRGLALLLTAVVVGKLGWEQVEGALPLSGGLPVVVDAHLYGAIGGLLAALSIQFHMRRWLTERRSI